MISEKKQVEYKKSLIVICIFLAIPLWIYYSYSFGKNKQLQFTERTEKILNKFYNNEFLYCQGGKNIIQRGGSGPIEIISSKDWVIDGYKFIDKKGKSFEFLDCEN